MATPLLQKARQRKMIYFGAIAVLLTVSLIHREFILKPQAFALQLRETARGEVELTSSAVRLMLTGSRGLAVTLLWYNAMEKQKRSEWHELELIVKSITKLQPYFVTPWLYQGWNISFNVAVECDKPRDKYYYISRGIELLAEGERRNRGTGDESRAADPNKIVFPGNPEMRYYIGFTYQLKIGTSDERLTMRSILDLSCIDPVERNPDLFWMPGGKDAKAVDLNKFADFTKKYPRLVRRLREGLGFNEPHNVVKFLQDHQNIPMRFKPVDKTVLLDLAHRKLPSEVKPVLEQFPLLPAKEDQHWPDPTKQELTSESIDVFLVCRTWYEFAQKPLPPPNRFPGVREESYDKMRYRVPKQMVTQLFRHYPPRAQVYIAETLESEGFFDSDGWNVKDWFDPLLEDANNEYAQIGAVIVGTEDKHHSRRAWQKGHQMYKDYGAENGLYFSAAETAELNQRAEMARRELNLTPEQLPTIRSDWREGDRWKSLEAHLRLYHQRAYRRLTNFDGFFDQSEGEMDPLTVAMRKYLFQAERMRRRGIPDDRMLDLYARGFGLFVHASTKHRKFGRVSSMQEDMYETHQHYLGKAQEVHHKQFTQAVEFAQRSIGPGMAWPEAIVRVQLVFGVTDKRTLGDGVLPIRNRFGPLDAVRFYDGQFAREVSEGWFWWTQGSAIASSLNFAALTAPERHYFALAGATSRTAPLATDWQVLINDEVRRIVSHRPGLSREAAPVK